MARRAPFLTLLAAGLALAGAAAAQQDPIGDLLGGAPEVAPTPAAPPRAPAPAQPVELDEDGQPIPRQEAAPPPAAEPSPPSQAVVGPPAEPAPAAPQAVAPSPVVTPSTPPIPEQAMSPAPPAAAPAPPMPSAPVPYRSLATPPSAQPPLAAAPAQVPPAPSRVAPAPYVPSPPSYASPTPAPYASPPAYAPYASPPMGVATAPPPSTNVRPSDGMPVNINERDRTPDNAPTYRELDYEQRLRASYASAQGLQGPLDGTWILSVDGDDLYTMELVDRSSGVLEGVWRDLRRTGSISGSGFVDNIQRYGGQLTFRFQPDTRDSPSSVTLAAGPDGRWTGELTHGGKHKPVILRRN